MSSIFLCAPTSDTKDYILPQYASLLSMMKRRYDYNIHICDNSRVFDKKKYERHLLKYTTAKVHHIKPKGSSTHFIFKSQALLREEFLKTKCEYFAFLETDLLPSYNVFEYLKTYNADVIGMPYYIGKNMNTCAMIQVMEEVSFGNRRVRTLSPMEASKYITGKPIKAYSIGFGTVLIKRHVIEQIPFRITQDEHVVNGIDGAHADSFFYADCHLKGIDVHLCTDHFINHYNQNWARLDNIKNNK